MRTLLIFLLCAASIASCRKRPEPTLPQIPDSNPIPGGGNTELADAVVFHTIYRYAGHAGQAHAFYKPEMEKRGATRDGEAYAANMQHSGSFGSQGTASPTDPRQPGVWLAVVELPEETRIDIWESVPKAH